MTQTDFNPAAIIVIFYPDPTALLRLVKVLTHQVNKIYVVDNTPAGFFRSDFSFGHPHIQLIRLGENLGVAAGQNVGIEKARSEGFSHVLLMDQDSEPSPDMLGTLFHHLSRLEKQGIKVAAVGPQLVNARNAKLRPFATVGGHHKKDFFSNNDEWILCDYLVASGSLIPLSVFTLVGEMDEALFIDCVDVEWAHRAATKGFVCVGVPGARMRYTQGNAQWNFLGYSMAKYPPIRHYYFFRNVCELCSRSYMQTAWKCRVLVTLLPYALLLSTAAPPRLQNLKMVVRGIHHGLRGRMGPIA